MALVFALLYVLLSALLYLGLCALFPILGAEEAPRQADPTKPAGYGTPTGNVQTINFPGATATLLQTAQQLAQLMLDLKSLGLIAA